MPIVPVALGERSYDIIIEQDALSNAETHLGQFARGGRLTVVTDSNVAQSQLPVWKRR